MNTSTRNQILNVIRTRGQISIADLATAIGISTISVRHHLASLQAEGLVSAIEVRHGVGRPHHAYMVTEAALERFPTKYMRLSRRLLDELKTALSPEALEEMFIRMAEALAAEYRQRLAGKPLEAKMEVLMELLGAEGFMAQWNRVGENILLTEYNCPYVQLSQRHPEVCAFDRAVIQNVLNATVEKTDCVHNGAERCAFVIVPEKPAPASV